MFLYALFIYFILSFFIVKYPRLFLILSLFLYIKFAADDYGVFSYVNQFIVFFVLGFFAGQRKNQLDSLLSYFTAQFIGLLLFPFLSYIYHEKLGVLYSDYVFYTFLTSVSGVFFIMILSNIASGVAARTLASIGAASILIYLGHIILASGGRIILDRLLGVQMLSVHVVFGMILGIIPLWCLFYLTKRYHFEWIYQIKLFSK